MKNFDNAVVVSGDVLESIIIRCQLIKQALKKGYHFKKIWFYVGNEQSKIMFDHELGKDEFKLIKQAAEIHMIVTHATDYVLDKGLELEDSKLMGNVLAIGPQATANQLLTRLRNKIDPSQTFLFSIAERDWQKEMNAFNYVKKHKSENQAKIAWFGSTFNYEIARATHVIVEQKNKTLNIKK